MSTVTYVLNCMYFVLKLSPFNCRSFASISFDIVLIQQQGLISNFKIPVVVRKYRDPPQKLFLLEFRHPLILVVGASTVQFGL